MTSEATPHESRHRPAPASPPARGASEREAAPELSGVSPTAAGGKADTRSAAAALWNADHPMTTAELALLLGVDARTVRRFLVGAPRSRAPGKPSAYRPSRVSGLLLGGRAFAPWPELVP